VCHIFSLILVLSFGSVGFSCALFSGRGDISDLDVLWERLVLSSKQEEEMDLSED
jgi:hypothetical protein